MKIKLYSLFILLLFSISSVAQIVLNGGGIIKINGGTSSNTIFMVLNNPPAIPIKTSGTTDGIIMESEYNRLQYNLGTATTSISVPYMSNLLEQLPLTVTPSAPGVGSGNIRFSGIVAPVRATGFDNLAYVPSDVANMGALPIVTNNSVKTIDRFWIIDANGYSTKPAVTLYFTYLDAEWAANGGNTIAEANLRAQRWNSTINDWGGYIEYLPTGSINTVLNTVAGVNVPAADFFKSWTLNDNLIPLPIDLLNFEATCINDQIVLDWCTASERNSDFFTIEQSSDNINFQTIGNVFARGTSSGKQCYQYPTYSVADINYFRLTETDKTGNATQYKTISVSACDANNEQIVLANDGSKKVGVILNSETDQYLQLEVHNTLGQLVETKMVSIMKGYNNIVVDLYNVSNAFYYISVNNDKEKLVSKKIIISDLNR